MLSSVMDGHESGCGAQFVCECRAILMFWSVGVEADQIQVVPCEERGRVWEHRTRGRGRVRRVLWDPGTPKRIVSGRF